MLFKTIECVWLNFAVPHFVRQEVSVAVTILQQLTEQLTCSGDDEEQQHHAAQERGFIVNAPAHLFVSVRLAKALPQLLESTIVSSYKHHLPGAICKTWPHCAEQQEQDPQPCTGWVVFPRSFLRGVLVAVQVLITGPYMYQRIFLRFALPVLFSGVCSVFYTIVQSTIALIVLGVVLGLGVVLTARYMYLQDSAALSTIVPVQSDSSMLEVSMLLSDDEVEEQERLGTAARAGRSASKSSLDSSDLGTPSPPSSEGSVRSGSWESDHTATAEPVGDEYNNSNDNHNNNNSNHNNHNSNNNHTNHNNSDHNNISDVEEGSSSSEDWPVSSEDTQDQEEEQQEEELQHSGDDSSSGSSFGSDEE